MKTVRLRSKNRTQDHMIMKQDWNRPTLTSIFISIIIITVFYCKF